MKIKSTIVVAAAAGVTLAPTAQAADLPLKAAPKVAPYAAWNWTGLYIGVHAGAAWQWGETSGTYDSDDFAIPFTNSGRSVGFIGGGQVGYNWQSGMIVYGLEADISGLTGSAKSSQIQQDDSDLVGLTSTNRIQWLGTVRGRVGAVLGSQTLIYVTGGFAFGGVKNAHSEFEIGGGDFAYWRDSGTRTGYAIGGGMEHMYSNNWSVRVEGLYVDLGSKTVSPVAGSECSNTCFPVTFKNEAVILRAALNYKFNPWRM